MSGSRAAWERRAAKHWSGGHGGVNPREKYTNKDAERENPGQQNGRSADAGPPPAPPDNAHSFWVHGNVNAEDLYGPGILQ